MVGGVSGEGGGWRVVAGIHTQTKSLDRALRTLCCSRRAFVRPTNEMGRPISFQPMAAHQFSDVIVRGELFAPKAILVFQSSIVRPLTGAF